MSDTPRMPEGVTPTPDSEEETFQSQVKRLTSLTQNTAENTDDMDSLLREELDAIRELKGVARKDVDQSKELHQKETQKQDREKRQETREKQQKEKTEEERHQGLTSKLSEGFQSVSKNVAQSVGNAGKNLGEEALNMALGPMRLITEPLQELTGFGVKDIGAGAFSLGKRMIGRGQEQSEPKTTTASNEAVTQEAKPVEQPSPEMGIQDITVSPDFVPQPAPFIDQSVTQELGNEGGLLNLEETTIRRERVRPRRSQLLQEGSIGAVGVYLGDILEEGGPSVERDDEGGIGGDILASMGGSALTTLLTTIGGSIGSLLSAALPVAIPLILGGIAAYGMSELMQLIFNVDREQRNQEFEDRNEASSDLQEAHDGDMGALHDTSMQAQERISDATFEPYDPGMYSSHMATVEDSENPFQDVEIPEDEIQPLHPAAILSQIAIEHPDSLSLIETHAQEGNYEAAQEEYERAAPRSIPEPVFEASDPSLIVPFLQGEEVNVPEHTGMGDSELPQDETYVGYSVQDFQEEGYPYDLIRDAENRRLLVEMSREHGREGTEDLIMEHEPDGWFQGGLGNAFDAFLESGEASQYVDDAIIRPDGEIIRTHPDDTLIATQNEVHDMSADNAIEPMMESRSLDQDINENFNRFVDQEGEVSFRESEEMISVLNQIRDAINNKPFNNIIQQMQSGSNIDKEAVRQGAL